MGLSLLVTAGRTLYNSFLGGQPREACAASAKNGKGKDDAANDSTARGSGEMPLGRLFFVAAFFAAVVGDVPTNLATPSEQFHA